MHGIGDIKVMNARAATGWDTPAVDVSYVTSVAIGRNYSTRSPQGQVQTAMSAEHWAAFVDDVSTLMRNHTEPELGDMLEISLGRGSWEGVLEDNARVTLTSGGTLNPSERKNLRRSLERLAGKYNQDSIALTVDAITVLIRP